MSEIFDNEISYTYTGDRDQGHRYDFALTIIFYREMGKIKLDLRIIIENWHH